MGPLDTNTKVQSADKTSLYTPFSGSVSTSTPATPSIFPFGMMPDISAIFNPFSFAMNNDFLSAMFEHQQNILDMINNPMNYYLGAPINFSNSYSAMKSGMKSMKLSAQSKELINGMSQRLGMNPEDLKAVIYSESSGNPHAVNKKSGATGLIQFMPSTARQFGTSTSAIYNMSAEEQLKPGGIVERYLAAMKKKAGFKDGEKLSGGQVYALVFMPAKAKKQVLTSSGKAYSWNSGLDHNHDGQITMADLDARVAHLRGKTA